MYVCHMANTNRGRDPLINLMDTHGYSVHSLAQATLIPETTLRRRLADRDFTVSQMRALADALDTTPSDVMKAAVEHRSTAA